MPDEIQKAVALELGIDDLDAPEQKDLIAEMSGVLLKAASLAVLGALPEEKRAGFMALALSGDEEGIKSFLATELPDNERIVREAVAEEVKRFKEAQKV